MFLINGYSSFFLQHNGSGEYTSIQVQSLFCRIQRCPTGKKHFINAHNIEKPLKLNKDITSKNGMERHLSTAHDGKKEFKCEMCDKVFSRKNNIKAHMESVHEGKKSFKCKVCDKNFSHKHHMIRHIVSVHEGRK